MSEAERVVKCPECARELVIGADTDISHLLCPHCEAEIPEQALRAESEIAEELAPGFRPGQRFGNYVIESLLGTGGMAVVFKGRQLSLNRHVAIKILPKDLMKKKLFVERFESEAAVLASLNHPNIVSVIDRGVESGTYYIVMEYVEGETLKDVIQREGTVVPERIVPIAEQTLAGLAYAHRRGVVHRDVKPGNVMINRDGIVKIADFGLAHLAKAQGGMDVTRENQAMGTLKYMAPEQLGDARGVDGRADVYSFGVCVYECLTGRLPLGMFKMPSEWDDSLDLRWDDVILLALKMDPEGRYANAEAMARAIREIASTPRITARQREEAEERAAEEALEEAAAPRVISPTACAHCGHENPPEARRCEQCDGALDDLLEKCPKCGSYNRIDIASCANCKVELTGYRQKRRRVAESLQNDAKRLAANMEFDQALANLRKLLKFRTREYAPLRRSAEAWIERINLRRDKHLQRLYEAGERMIAEGHAERGLQIWESLPEGYRDVAPRRTQILDAKKRAEANIAAGDKLYKAGGLEAAIEAWSKAAQFLVHDQKLNKRLSRAKIELGNLKLRRGYVEDAKTAASQGKFNEATELCRKALDLDAEDPAALAFLRRMEEHRARTPVKRAKRRRKWGVRDFIPLRPVEHQERTPLTRKQIVTISVSVVSVLVVLLSVGLGIPLYRANRDQKAEALYTEAGALEAAGNETGALKLTDRIVAEYPKTASAGRAKEKAENIRRLHVEAQALCNEADTLAEGGGLEKNITGFKQFQSLLSGSAVTESGQWRSYASTRLEELRALITDDLIKQAGELQKQGKWRQAMKTYLRMREEFKSPEERIGPLADRAQRRITRCEEQVAASESAAKAGQWRRALDAGLAALDFVPEDEAASRMVRQAVIHVPPPEGMVLVPPGEYEVAGSGGRPRRKIYFAHGFYIDRTEVACGAFDRYLKAQRREPLPTLVYEEMPAVPEDPARPAAGMTWSEADAYARATGKLLPTEEMYECAARGLDGTSYPWGGAWYSNAGAFGFGAVRTDEELRDRSACGALHLAGNVAEWSATSIQAPRQEFPPSPSVDETGRPIRRPPEEKVELPQSFHVVKGTSWMGLEEQRPTKTVVRPLAYGDDKGLLLLTPDESQRDKAVRFPADLQIGYLGPSGAEGANVGIRRWAAAWRGWAGARVLAVEGKPIGIPVNVILQFPNGARSLARADLLTGCVMVGQEPPEWLLIELPSGVVSRVPKWDFQTPKVIEVPESAGQAATSPISLGEAAESASRMAGRDGARYVNVGLRCMKWVWTPMTFGEIRREDQE
jgi:serine/threonine protein kinase/formylglycine-generating enzyme required for sulfatase activity